VTDFEPLARELLAPLIPRQLAGKAGLVLARHDGEAPAPALLTALHAAIAGQGLRAEQLAFSELGEAPVAALLHRCQARKVAIFLILLDPEALRLDESQAADRLAALNFRRRDFISAGLLAVFFVPQHGFRLVYENASNFLDFRLRIVDVPGDRQKPTPVQPLPPNNLPFASLGPLFVGRQGELDRLRQSLETVGATAITQPTAIQGLGGIGKTRLAVEYGQRSLQDYRWVLFVRADTPLDLKVQLGDLAGLLQLPEAGRTDQNERYEAVIRFLASHPGWLLIIDNADSEESAAAVEALLPHFCGQGHVLITSRFRRWSGALTAEALTELRPEEAVRYLLLKTKGARQEEVQEREEAEALASQLADKLGNLPLALEQAAAHIAAHGLSFRDYLRLWQEGRAEALEWYRAEAMPNYPLPVAVTLLSSFEAITPEARAMLWLLAWFAPTPLPEAVLDGAAGIEVLGLAMALANGQTNSPAPDLDPLMALATLDRHCLVRRREDGTVSVHRLVQEVVRTRIPAPERQQWLGLTLRLALNFLLPDPSPQDVRSWPRWEPMRDHAAVIVDLALTQGLGPEARQLMARMGSFLSARALFREAEPLIRQALAITEQGYGPEHPSVAAGLINLAALLQATNRLTEAEPIMRRALAIDEQSYGPDHPDVAIDLNNLATLLQATNRLAEAEPLMRRALAIDEQGYGPEHPDVAIDLNNLATLLQDTNRRAEAEPLMRRALAIAEQSYGPEHPAVASSLNNLATLLQATKRLAEAEPLMRRALTIDEQSYGPEHPAVARDLNNLAQLLQDTKRLAEAEPIMRRALAINEQSYGPKHPAVAASLNNLAQLLQTTKRLAEAEPLMRRALAIDEQSYGPEHPAVARDLNNLALMFKAANRLAEAEPLMRRVVSILHQFGKSTGHRHPHMEDASANYLSLLQALGLSSQAIAARLKQIFG